MSEPETTETTSPNPPEWETEYRRTCDQLMAAPLPGAPVADPAAVEACLELLRSVMTEHAPHPQVIVRNDGSLQLEWHVTIPLHIEVDVNAHGVGGYTVPLWCLADYGRSPYISTRPCDMLAYVMRALARMRGAGGVTVSREGT